MSNRSSRKINQKIELPAPSINDYRMKKLTPELLLKAKRYGFSDVQIAHLTNASEDVIHALRKKWRIASVFKTVDTCAAEFEAFTPYYYSTYEQENDSSRSPKKKVIILGGGPNRIGQGIEFDYCCVHGLFALREEGFEAIMINCNPETVSTDYDSADKLYFEPLTFEDVYRIIEHEQPDGVIVSFGGQTPLKLAKKLVEHGVNILGTPYDGIDLAEDRERFSALLRQLKIAQPPAGNARTEEEAVEVARKIGYPILLRPSYVLGGRGMHILYSEAMLRQVIHQAIQISDNYPVLIDKFLEDAVEFDVDAVSDGTDVVIGGVMQHIEEAGIHSGDSTCILPPPHSNGALIEEMKEKTKAIARGLGVIGLVNIQYAVQGETIFVLEANPRASRTVPFVSKATGVPLAKIATKVMVGRTLHELDVQEIIPSKHISIKKSVFPFIKLRGAKQFLGPEMHSTGEVMGIGSDFAEAMVKAQLGSGALLPTAGCIFLSVNNADKTYRVLQLAKHFIDAGFTIISTGGTSEFLTENNITNRRVMKVHEGRPDIVDAIKNDEVQLVINTPLGEISRYDESAIGATALEYNIPMLTNISAAFALLEGIKQAQKRVHGVRSLQEHQA